MNGLMNGLLRECDEARPSAPPPPPPAWNRAVLPRDRAGEPAAPDGAAGMLRQRRLFADRRPPVANASMLRLIGGKASRFLARNVRAQSMAMRNSEPVVTFTFDDAPASSAELGAAILERNGMRGTFYIAGGGCGALSPNGPLASIDQLRALAASGHEIGCHTFTHPAVSSITIDELAEELRRNSAFLHHHAGIIPRNFAYPYGDVSFRTKLYLGSRFDSCRSDYRGVNTGTLDLGTMKCCALENASINRARIMTMIRQAVNTNGWLIFSSHAVECNPGRFGVTPDLLAFTVAAARAERCRTVTVAAGLELAKGPSTPAGFEAPDLPTEPEIRDGRETA